LSSIQKYLLSFARWTWKRIISTGKISSRFFRPRSRFRVSARCPCAPSEGMPDNIASLNVFVSFRISHVASFCMKRENDRTRRGSDPFLVVSSPDLLLYFRRFYHFHMVSILLLSFYDGICVPKYSFTARTPPNFGPVDIKCRRNYKKFLPFFLLPIAPNLDTVLNWFFLIQIECFQQEIICWRLGVAAG
jgi:hypothetical protein